jgi:hypothetical protein
MSKEMIGVDQRLEGIDLNNAQAVYNALVGKNHHFNVKSYLTLPIGQRLLTEEELSSLNEDQRKPIPENENDPYYLSYFFAGVTQGNGGVSAFDYNWDPINRRLVYENSVPDEMVYAMQEIKGPKCKANDKKMWEVIKANDKFYNG